MKSTRRAGMFDGAVLRRARQVGLAGLGLAVFLTGCIDQVFQETGAVGLERFSSADEFKSYLADQMKAVQRWGGGGFPDLFFLGGPVAFTSLSSPTAEGDAAGGFSTTNVQEEGVDESDVVKNDGEFVYVLSGNALRIVRAVPADSMEIVASVALSGTPFELYLNGDTIVALSSDYSTDGSVTTITVVDATDRAAPTVRGVAEATGRLLTSRMVGSILHLVLQSRPLVVDENEVTATDVHNLIPDVRITLGSGGSVVRDLVDWSDLYHPIDPDGYSITAIVSLDVMDANLSMKSIGVMADAGAVYASRDALYLTDQQYNYASGLRETTDIYKFALKDAGASPVGAGSVPGRVLNQYSMSEHEGFLRIATTVGQVWFGAEAPSLNNVYVMEQRDGELRVTGKIEGIAPGERIYSARFIGDRGFLVTFKKIDPLFTLDLSDATNPRVVGKLKVPGYSDYIHPLGENHLLTIGKDAIDMGDFALFQGVQLSVFDVTDLSDPRRVDVETIGDRGTESEALHNPHAFNFFASAGMLAVPMTIAEGADSSPSSYGTPTFQGVCLYRIDPQTGIEPAAQIATDAAFSYPYPGAGGWARGLFIDDYLYVVTASEIQAVPIADLGADPVRIDLD